MVISRGTALSLLLLVSVAVCDIQPELAALQQMLEHRAASIKRFGECNATLPIPMWSWGFPRICCQVFPDRLGMKRNTIFEYGDLNEAHYFKQKEIKNGDAVYVTSPDIPLFLNTFLRLPTTWRIVLVTGAEDIGLPYELFHPHRVNFFDYNKGALWPSGQLMTMRQFLGDSRLSKWFVQNYDLVGCNIYTCSDIKEAADTNLIDKVDAIPIGLDLHSFSEKRGLDEKSSNDLLCGQRKELESLSKAALPFPNRRVAAIAGFDCKFDNSRIGVGRKKTRGELCKLISENHKNGNSIDIVMLLATSTGSDENSSRRLKFWTELGSVAFALAPAGFGTDTHRFWESLEMGTVPIVLTSTLDRLYSQFPCIIVDNWSQVFQPNALAAFFKQITDKFGSEPFNETVRYRLTIEHWASLIDTERRKILK